MLHTRDTQRGANVWFVPVESLHLVGATQHVAPVFSKLLQGPPAIVQLLRTKTAEVKCRTAPLHVQSNQ